MGRSLTNFPLGTESQRWPVILRWKSVIAYLNCYIREPIRRRSRGPWGVLQRRSVGNCEEIERRTITTQGKHSGKPLGGEANALGGVK